jgi:hypothetical protein
MIIGGRNQTVGDKEQVEPRSAMPTPASAIGQLQLLSNAPSMRQPAI